MFAYYVSKDSLDRLNIGAGQNWETFEPGTATILVHPRLDYHAIWGDLFLRNDDTTNIVAMDYGEKVCNVGVFILALNHKDAREMLSRE